MNAKEDKQLLGAYLVVGEDELKRRRVLDRLRKRVAALGDLEFNHDEFDGENASGEAIVAACNTLPFASELRLVEVKDGQKLKAADLKEIETYLGSPNPATVLAFSTEKLAKNTRLHKAFSALGKQAVIDCAPMKRYELARAVRSMAAGYGFTMADSGAAKLIELAGEDTVRLDQELKKLSLAAAPNTAMGEREVEALVSRTTEAKPWELLDALCARDLKRSLLLLSLTGDSPLKLLAMATARFRELACAKSLAARGSLSELPQILGVPAWRVKHHGEWARNYSESEIRQVFSKARDCERLLKSTSGNEGAFVDWIISVVAPQK